MKFNVTQELSTLVKMVRGQNGISSKDLAAFIQKSPSYVSKLEAGNARKIQKEDLTNILEYITPGEDFYRDKLPALIHTLNSFMDPNRLMAQSWLLQYDIIDRPLSVDKELAAELQTRIRESGISPSELTELINLNLDSSASRKIPVNEVKTVEWENGEFFYIRTFVEQRIVELLSHGEPVLTNYNSLYSIVFYLFRLRYYGGKQKRDLPATLASQILAETTDFLDLYNIHTLTGYGKVLTSHGFQNRQMGILDTIDLNNPGNLIHILSNLQLAEANNPEETDQALSRLAESMDWDPAFMLKLMGFPFVRLDGLSFHYKKEVLEKILDILNEYAGMPEEQKKLETY